MAAAGRERRAERLNERLRGAQRTNVGDDSFNLNIDGLDQPPAEPSSPRRRTPNTSAGKRKRKDEQTHESSQDRRATRSATKARPDSTEASGPPTTSASKSRLSDKTNGSLSRTMRRTSGPASIIANQTDLDADELGAGAPPSSSMQSPERSRLSGATMEEVEESPTHAPGSGRRRNLQLSPTASSAARRLRFAVSTDDTAPPSSSPLARKVRINDAATSMRSRGSTSALSRRSMSRKEDELLSDDRPREATIEEELPDPLLVDGYEPESQGQPEEAAASAEEAKEIDAAEAAKALGRKRPRNIRTSSPELGSGAAETEQEEPEPEPESEPRTRKRARPRATGSASQNQPAANSRSNEKIKPGPKPKKHKDPPPGKKQRKQNSTSDKRASKSRRESDNGDEDDAIEITIQRFAKNRKRARGDGDDDLDPLQAEIPYANCAGESVVDVLAQVCGEVMAATLAQFRELADEADSATKKECRVKMRAIEAYRGELGSRLLQHAIHLNHWHSLRKQVRHTQKEKLALRDEILRLTGEREQVALRMDAVRIKHEADSNESTRRINTSALMHDIDVAVEQGREAPELSHEAQKRADLANLELTLARLADEASSWSSTGGILCQVSEFNAFLERAALALEAK